MNIDKLIAEALIEDIGDGDHTSLATISPDAEGKATLIIKEDGILAGVEIAKKVFHQVDQEIIVEQFLEDGQKVAVNDHVFVAKGRIISLLTAERLVLNFMQRMSGIATYTSKVVECIRGTNTKLLDTRKTTPLLRELEKQAVKTGGGHNHRLGLYDMIMIKDNHIDFAGGIEQAIQATTAYLINNKKQLRIEIEVRDFQELDEVLSCGGVDRIMLDNFSPSALKLAIDLIDKQYETEASGGIHLGNIRRYAETGVDYISMGALTHQIKSLDMSLKAVK